MRMTFFLAGALSLAMALPVAAKTTAAPASPASPAGGTSGATWTKASAVTPSATPHHAMRHKKASHHHSAKSSGATNPHSR